MPHPEQELTQFYDALSRYLTNGGRDPGGSDAYEMHRMLRDPHGRRETPDLYTPRSDAAVDRLVASAERQLANLDGPGDSARYAFEAVIGAYMLEKLYNRGIMKYLMFKVIKGYRGSAIGHIVVKKRLFPAFAPPGCTCRFGYSFRW